MPVFPGFRLTKCRASGCESYCPFGLWCESCGLASGANLTMPQVCALTARTYSVGVTACGCTACILSVVSPDACHVTKQRSIQKRSTHQDVTSEPGHREAGCVAACRTPTVRGQSVPEQTRLLDVTDQLSAAPALSARLVRPRSLRPPVQPVGTLPGGAAGAPPVSPAHRRRLRQPRWIPPAPPH